jgi:hypothetical protein
MDRTVAFSASRGVCLVSCFEWASGIGATLNPRQNARWRHRDRRWRWRNQYAGGGRGTRYLRDKCSTRRLPEGRRSQQTDANHKVGHSQVSKTRNPHIDAESVSENTRNQNNL